MLIAVSVLWSLAGLSVKTARMNPLAFAFYRCVAAAIPMAVFACFSTGSHPPIRWMAFSAVVYTLVVTPFIAAMTLGTAASGILLQYTSPAFCAMFAWLFMRKRIDGRTLLAIAMAVLGVGIMLGVDRVGQDVRGPALGLLSGVAFGALPLVLSQVDRRCHGRANPFLIVFYNNLGAALLLFPFCLHFGVLPARPWQLAIVGATGAFQLALPYVLFQLALRRVSPVDAALLILFEPVLNPLWVYLYVGETPGIGTVVGGIAILAALVIEATKSKNLPDDSAG